MIKRLNKYLLLHYPQLWNTRVVWALGTIAIIHALFFIAGVGHFEGFHTLHRYYSVNFIVDDSVNIVFSMLASALVFIIWLVYYLRNNPFKSFYPLPNLYFLKEFSIQFIIILFGIMFYASYANGFYGAIRAKTKDVNIKDEINTTNLAYALLLQNASDYNRYASCESQDFNDSLMNLRNTYYSTKTKQVQADELDSIINDFNQHQQNDNAYSYFNFCRKYYTGIDNESTLDNHQIAAQLRKWLLSSDSVAMLQLLTKFEAMCKRYEVYYHADIPSYATKPFKNPGFALNFNDFMTPVYSVEPGYEGNTESIYFNDLTTTLESIDNIRHSRFDLDFWLVNAYLALGFALLLFTFRLTSIRVWLTSLIGAGVIAIVLSLMAIGISSTGGNLLMLMFIVGLFYLLHILAKSEKRKILAGVNLVWFTWCLPYFGFLLWGYLCEIRRPFSYYEESPFTPDPLYAFLTNHHSAIFLVNFVIVFIVTGWLVAKHYQSWMAMEEE